MLSPAVLESRRSVSILIFTTSIVFYILRWEDIFLPSYWDEMASYVNGILHMCEHGISMHPSAIPEHTSYGHPLFMHCVMACLLKVFGREMYILHITTVAFTLLTAFATYLLSFQLSKNRLISCFAFLIFLAQPIVIAQSTQVLLETFLCMLTLYAIVFYLQKQYFIAMVFTCLGILSKETGLVLAIAFFAHLLLRLYLETDKKAIIKQLCLFSLPFILFGGFLMITKATYGWYLNPVNVGKSKLVLGSMLQKMLDYPIEINLFDQGRFFFTSIGLLALGFFTFQKNKVRSKAGMEIVLLIIFSFGFILFSSIADALERYFILLIPFVAILFANACMYFSRFHRVLPFILVFAGITTNLMFLSSNKRYTEVDLGYRHVVYTNMAVFKEINSGAYEGDTIGFDFPFQFPGSNPGFGYYSEKHFINDSLFSNHCKYKVYTSPGNFDWNPPDELRYQKIHEFKSAYSISYLYKRKS